MHHADPLRSVHPGGRVVRGCREEIATRDDPAKPDVRGGLEERTREMPERGLMTKRHRQPGSIEDRRCLTKHRCAFAARLLLELGPDTRADVTVMETVGSEVGPRQRLEPAYELGMPIEAHRSFRKDRREPHALGDDRDSG